MALEVLESDLLKEEPFGHKAFICSFEACGSSDFSMSYSRAKTAITVCDILNPNFFLPFKIYWFLNYFNV